MLTYQQRDQARDLYTNHDWSLNELKVKYGCNISERIIPMWMQRARADRLRKTSIEKAKAKKKADKLVRLNRKEAKQVKAISNKIRKFDLKSVTINIKQCPINRYLMRA